MTEAEQQLRVENAELRARLAQVTAERDRAIAMAEYQSQRLSALVQRIQRLRARMEQQAQQSCGHGTMDVLAALVWGFG